MQNRRNGRQLILVGIVVIVLVLGIGFFLMKYVVFHDSNIRGRVQLFRYFFVFVSNLFINYILLKILVEYLNVYAILAQVISTTVVIIISYLLQRHFTFKIEQPETEVD